MNIEIETCICRIQAQKACIQNTVKLYKLEIVRHNSVALPALDDAVAS